MKKCRCKACGGTISLMKRENIVCETIRRGYKFLHYDYYAKCPHCKSRQPLSYKEIPFLMKVRLFWEA